MSLKSFLQNIKHNLLKFQRQQLIPTLHIVLGNEAADADSLISTLCYAYLKQHSNAQQIDEVMYIPAAGVPRLDMPLRRDVQLALQKVNLCLDDLICLDEILEIPPITEEFIAQKKIIFTLCDHNALAAPLEPKYGSNVVAIVDHHVDRGFYPWIQGDALRHIAFANDAPTAMSTCTLIAEAYLQYECDQKGNDHSDDADKVSYSLLTEDLATLLLAVIAVDSSNGTTATPRDVEVMTKLQMLTPYPSGELFTLLSSAKLDPMFWKELHVSDALRLDYKMFQVESTLNRKTRRVGIASVLQPITLFFEKNNCAKTVYDTMKNQNLSCFAVMTFVLNPEAARELVVYSHCPDHLHFLCNHLSEPQNQLDLSMHDDESISERFDQHKHQEIESNTRSETLLLHKSSDATNTETDSKMDTDTSAGNCSDEGKHRLFARVYKQGNTRASRKMVAPLIVSFEESR